VHWAASHAAKKPELAGFEVLIAMVMKISVFWYITTCSPVKIKRNFGEA
jgi:hypothetical protein